MRSTWVRTIRLQQYLLSWSSSRASLGSGSARTRAQGAALVPLGDVLGEELKVGVPFVADDLSTRETTDWDDLWGRVRKGTGDVLRDGP